MAKYRLPKPGDLLSDISSSGLRAAFRAGEALEAGELAGPSTGEFNTSRIVDPSVVWVLNTTGQDLLQYSVVGLDEPLHLPQLGNDPSDQRPIWEFLAYRAFRAVLPSVEQHWTKLAIVTHGIAAGQYGKAQYASIVKARVRIPPNAGTQYDRAGILEDDTEALHIHPGGIFKILWHHAEPIRDSEGEETDMYWGVVQFGDPPEGWSPLRNTHNGDMPAYAIAEVSGWSVTDGLVHLNGTLPTTSAAAGYAINGPTAIGQDKVGYAYIGDEPVFVRLQDQGVPPIAGENWGPLPGAWHIARENADAIPLALFGFELQSLETFAEDAGLDRRILCRPWHPPELKVVVDQDFIAPGDSGICQVWENGIDTGRKISAALNWNHADEYLLRDNRAVARWQHKEQSDEYGWYLAHKQQITPIVRVRLLSPLGGPGQAANAIIIDGPLIGIQITVRDYMLLTNDSIAANKQGAAIYIGTTWWLISIQCPDPPPV